MRIMRKGVLFEVVIVAAMVLAFGAGSASAAWESNGPGAVAATGGATTFTINAPTPVGYSCSGSTLNGSLVGPAGPAGGSWTAISGVTLGFTGCSTAGWVMNVTCSTAGRLLVTGYNALTDTTTGNLGQFTCTKQWVSFPGCTFTYVASGTGGNGLPVTYSNLTGQLTVGTAGQTLTATWTSGCAMITPRPGTASATFSGTYTFTPALKPCIRFGVAC